MCEDWGWCTYLLFLTFILNEKLQFISVTYLWSHGVDEKGQSGLEPVDPTATPMFFHVENRCSILFPCRATVRRKTPRDWVQGYRRGCLRAWSIYMLRGHVTSYSKVGQSNFRVDQSSPEFVQENTTETYCCVKLPNANSAHDDARHCHRRFSWHESWS